MVERAFVEEAATAGNVPAEDVVNAAQGASPLGFVGSEKHEGGGADEGGEVGE